MTQLLNPNQVLNLLGTKYPDLKFEIFNKEKYLRQDEGARFLIFSAQTKDNTKLFIKVTNQEKLIKHLKKEVGALKLALDINIPTTNVLESTKQLDDNTYYYVREWLAEDNTHKFVHDLETLSGFEEKELMLATYLISKYCGLEVALPNAKDFVCGTYMWARDFNHMWSGTNRMFGFKKQSDRAINYLGHEGEQIQKIRDQIFSEFTRNFDISSSGLYFVHNDCTPKNFYYDLENNNAIYIDLEYSCLSTSKIVAMTTDIGNFYARCNAKPHLQLEFLELIYPKLQVDKRKKKTFLKFAIMLGALSVSANGLEGMHHKEYIMARRLIDNFKPSLNLIDKL